MISTLVIVFQNVVCSRDTSLSIQWY